MKNQKRQNDDKFYCLLFDCVLYPLQRVKSSEWGNVSMVWLVSDANWFSNLWIHIEWLLTGRRMINSANHFRWFTAYFDKKFGQKWSFRLFLHSTYQSSRKSEICSRHFSLMAAEKATGRLQPVRAAYSKHWLRQSPRVFQRHERWGVGVKTQKNVRGVFGGWGRVPFNEPYAPSLSTIYDGA